MERHPLDVMSLLFGSIFLLIGIAGLNEADWLALRYEVLVPAVIIVLGVGLLASARRPQREAADGEIEADEDAR